MKKEFSGGLSSTPSLEHDTQARNSIPGTIEIKLGTRCSIPESSNVIRYQETCSFKMGRIHINK
jgi:hypothetical protein